MHLTFYDRLLNSPSIQGTCRSEGEQKLSQPFFWLESSPFCLRETSPDKVLCEKSLVEMPEVAGPSSPADVAVALEVDDIDPVLGASEEENQPKQENQPEISAEEASEASLSKVAVEPSHDVVDSPATISPESSPVSPPDESKTVVPNSPPSAAKTAPSLPAHNFVTSNRRRVVSLDRGHELRRVVSLDRGRELLSEMEGMNSSSDLSNAAEDLNRQRAYSNEDYDDEESLGSNSSDGESSYFAKHLPSPKSGRRWSYSDAASTSSAPARAGLYGRNSSSHMDRESDASLSFSDDDEDDHVRPEMKIVTSRSPMLPPPVPKDGSDDLLPPFPQRITRIHSMNSLVSSSSDDGKGIDREVSLPPSRSGSHGSLSSSDGSVTTSSDPSIRDELRHVAVPNKRQIAGIGGNRPMNGRVPPLSGAHYSGYFTGYLPTPPSVPQASPPPIFQGHPPPNAQEVAHPQPMTSEQMGAWLADGNMLAPPFMPPPQFFPPTPTGYGATALVANPTTPLSSDAINSSTNSAESANVTLTMVYSEDEETDDGRHGQNMASGGQGQEKQGTRGKRSENPFDQGENLEAGRRGPESHDFLGMGMYGTGPYATQQKVPGASGDGADDRSHSPADKGFTVYKQRWLMLLYMSVLNLLSDWTCYSVAPISLLVSEAFGKINPEQLVVVFLGANAVATACEPIILSRLGLRRTILFGAFLLMAGSIVKSGGLPPILGARLTKGQGEWRVYLGYFLVGLSQPLYQCTPALLSASWFPERERTMATGVALNANQLGIGFAFIFGTLLVAKSDDISPYFGLLSTLSTITFLGCLFQFDDAPPTPPSDTARVIRGTMEWKLPGVDSIWNSVKSLKSFTANDDRSERERSDSNHSGSKKGQPTDAKPQRSRRSKEGLSAPRRKTSVDSGRSGRKSRRPSSTSRKSSSQSPRPTSRKQAQPVRQSGNAPTSVGTNTRRRSTGTSRNQSATSESGFRAVPGLAPPPSPASRMKSSHSALEITEFERESHRASVVAPSPMMPGPVGPAPADRSEDESPLYDDDDYSEGQSHQRPPDSNDPPSDHGFPQVPQYGAQYPRMPMPMGYQYPQWQHQYWDSQYHHQQPLPQYQHPAYQQHPGYFPQQQGYHQQGFYYYPQQGYYYPQVYPQFNATDFQQAGLPNTSKIDEGAEPVVMISSHHLDINIRDDQILLSARACLSRPGFIQVLVAFTASGIVINTLSTFMDYLVRLNGAPRMYTGIVGGSFQFVIMISSLVIGKQTDRTRAYYSVIIALLVCGAFALAECGVSLDADRGTDLRWTLIVVAALVGPLQPVSTELGVDVAYPLSENTVLVIQQLFSNLLSAMFIPFFKALKDVGTKPVDDADYERPEYTFSFYLLVVLHATATVFFATFNGRYLRYEQEMAKKAQEEAKMMFGGPTAFHPVQGFEGYQPAFEAHAYDYEHDKMGEYSNENQPLVHRVV